MHGKNSMVRTFRATGEPGTGCSKSPSSKAAASEEAKEVPTALRVGRSPLQYILANGKAPTVLPTSETLLLNLELLSDARTQLADFFSILLEQRREWREHDRQSHAMIPVSLAA